MQLRARIREQIDAYNRPPFQKREGSRLSVFTGAGLRAARTRAWRKTTEQDPQAKTALIENHMLDGNGKRDFSSEVTGTRLCGDITY